MIKTKNFSASFRRSKTGVTEIHAEDELGFYRALGFAHARDRRLQMVATRAFARGRLTEEVYDSDETFHYDFLMRKLDLAEETEGLTDRAWDVAQAYCEGVNACFSRKVKPWCVEDILVLLKMHMYLGMAQAQEQIEKFIIQSALEGVSTDALRKIFAPHLEGLSKELLEGVHLEEPFLEQNLHFHPTRYSNNWVVGGQKSVSGAPLMCFDPHLAINILPSTWYEIVAHFPGDYRMGITTPGVPGLIMGRTRSLSASFTYGMMDTVDFFIEECRNEACLREGKWIPLRRREESIRRRKKGETKLLFYESDVGVVETGGRSLKEGKYLSLAWSARKKGGASTLNALTRLWTAENVEEAQEITRNVAMSCNWLFADRKGNIGYQQSGWLPQKAGSGLFPLPAKETRNHWKGIVPSEKLDSVLNPPEGFLCTANEGRDQEVLAITVPHAPYRANRIRQLLGSRGKWSIDEMKTLQKDHHSLQAKAFLKEVEIPDTSEGKLLKEWDFSYESDAREPTLFEAFYHSLRQEVFGALFGKEAWEKIVSHTSLLVFIYGQFDTYLLEEKRSQFEPVLRRTLEGFASRKIPAWGKRQPLWFRHPLFGARIPKLLGRKVGPYQLGGSRATIAPSLFFYAKKRPIFVGQSYRFLSDLSTDDAWTALPGGASENIFFRAYSSGIERWATFKYKKID